MNSPLSAMPPASFAATAAYSSRPYLHHTDVHLMERPAPLPKIWRATGASWAEVGTLAAHRIELADTREQLVFTRTEKLLPAVWHDWQEKQAYLKGVDSHAAMVRFAVLLCAVPLAATAISVGFTFEQSLYVRASLPVGMLYVEVNLGGDADTAEDTFASIRAHRQEQWSASGPFAQVALRLSQHVSD